jgi:hypothetical protein
VSAGRVHRHLGGNSSRLVRLKAAELESLGGHDREVNAEPKKLHVLVQTDILVSRGELRCAFASQV